MAIVPLDELEKYIGTMSFEIGHEAWNLLDHFRDGRLSRERVIENVTRRLSDAMNTIEESYRSSPEQGGYYLER